jgi:hypothetical protein
MGIRKPDHEPDSFVTATHDVLFASNERDARDDDAPRCDACDAALVRTVDEDGFAVGGRGVYLWTRGDEIRFEEAPLCPDCASAIGMSVLARWEIEEEEG